MDIFECDIDITDVVFACKVSAGCGERVHNDRKSYGLAFYTNGENTYTFKDGRTLTAKKNDIIFLPQGSSYVVDEALQGECYAINFKLRKTLSVEPFVFHTKASLKYHELFKEAEKSFRERRNGYSINCKAKLYSLIYVMTCERSAEYFPKHKKENLLPAIEYIHTHYAVQSIEIDLLASLCGIKSAYFRRAFLQCYGVSPIKYINALKLARAKSLLLQSGYSVEMVSEMSGFNNICYFHRFFKKEVGMTPSEYRSDPMQSES